MARTELLVNGMTCSHCEHAVRAEILTLDGVTGVTVDSTSGEVSVEHEMPLAAEALSAAVEEAGYEVRSSAAARDA
ncbi:heavy-metal-associated domain-containing protein [Microbacterium sp. SA39]|uniref:heavy-metal-associated domain-containing protein n=1 Tax=Microbacterium sp. SA39 TaxID=1263625 RepID=UPI00061F06D1|nr:heavy metal-associated domain-containing protein [Microbacterium sp. SA39]KJQ53182.1 Copper chaperone CopZ [Microbacterium sp. SA39]